MGNPPGPSIGCGKDLGSLKSGIYSITSAGLSRRYVIDIPANYDKNHPYRLIFGMHCNCGTMYSVRSEKFYEIKRCADSANVPCIFVAPSAYATNYDSASIGCPGWNQSEKDHTFFDDMLALFKSELCVDTTRVFSGGFSYGAMFSNSLAQNHQKVLRGVIIYEGANVNIYVPNNIGLPIAYMGLVGLSDGTCTPAMGRACRDTAVKYNGCTVPSTVPETKTGSKTHVIYDYQGCPNYPVKWCTFDGDHQWAEYDGVSSGWDPAKTWTAEVAWHFIYQF
jgi:poly(3-hydroxybutyrate) depolymerase